ncbi:MAG: FkbM family methyltransferase [Terriglobia bacterium]
MNLASISNQTIPGKVLRLPLKLVPKQAIVPIWQGKLRGKKWIAGSSDHGCWLGSYEHAQRRLFEDIVERGSVVFDIGAHAGFYTLLASTVAGPSGRVFAFEPSPSNMLFLKRHLLLNGISNVTTIAAAVSDREGYALFEEGPTSSQGRLSPFGRLKVRTVSLDELISRGEIPVPAFLKIDAEGAESEVLKGACATLSEAHPTIFLSTHGERRRQQCMELLGPLGYRLQPIGADTVETAREILASTRLQQRG